MNGERKFRKDYGRDVEKIGYVQVPHHLHRKASDLNLTPFELAVSVLLLGYGAGYYVTAERIAGELGINIKTVRNCFRSLEQKKLMERHLVTRNANYFTFNGLKARLRAYALNS